MLERLEAVAVRLYRCGRFALRAGDLEALGVQEDLAGSEDSGDTSKRPGEDLGLTILCAASVLSVSLRGGNTLTKVLSTQ
jgi:hypothetical protein